MKLKKGSLIDKRTELFLKKDLANRIKKANTQTSKEYRERKHQQKFKKKNNKKNGKKSGSVEDYDNDHNKNLHNDEIDLTTTAVDVLAAAVKTSKKRKKKNYKCSICGKTNDHNKSKCPQVAAMNNTNTNKRTKTN